MFQPSHRFGLTALPSEGDHDLLKSQLDMALVPLTALLPEDLKPQVHQHACDLLGGTESAALWTKSIALYGRLQYHLSQEQLQQRGEQILLSLQPWLDDRQFFQLWDGFSQLADGARLQLLAFNFYAKRTTLGPHLVAMLAATDGPLATARGDLAQEIDGWLQQLGQFTPDSGPAMSRRWVEQQLRLLPLLTDAAFLTVQRELLRLVMRGQRRQLSPLLDDALNVLMHAAPRLPLVRAIRAALAHCPPPQPHWASLLWLHLVGDWAQNDRFYLAQLAELDPREMALQGDGAAVETWLNQLIQQLAAAGYERGFYDPLYAVTLFFRQLHREGAALTALAPTLGPMLQGVTQRFVEGRLDAVGQQQFADQLGQLLMEALGAAVGTPNRALGQQLLHLRLGYRLSLAQSHWRRPQSVLLALRQGLTPVSAIPQPAFGPLKSRLDSLWFALEDSLLAHQRYAMATMGDATTLAASSRNAPGCRLGDVMRFTRLAVMQGRLSSPAALGHALQCHLALPWLAHGETLPWAMWHPFLAALAQRVADAQRLPPTEVPLAAALQSLQQQLPQLALGKQLLQQSDILAKRWAERDGVPEKQGELALQRLGWLLLTHHSPDVAWDAWWPWGLTDAPCLTPKALRQLHQSLLPLLSADGDRQALEGLERLLLAWQPLARSTTRADRDPDQPLLVGPLWERFWPTVQPPLEAHALLNSEPPLALAELAHSLALPTRSPFHQLYSLLSPWKSLLKINDSEGLAESWTREWRLETAPSAHVDLEVTLVAGTRHRRPQGLGIQTYWRTWSQRVWQYGMQIDLGHRLLRRQTALAHSIASTTALETKTVAQLVGSWGHALHLPPTLAVRRLVEGSLLPWLHQSSGDRRAWLRLVAHADMVLWPQLSLHQRPLWLRWSSQLAAVVDDLEEYAPFVREVLMASSLVFADTQARDQQWRQLLSGLLATALVRDDAPLPGAALLTSLLFDSPMLAEETRDSWLRQWTQIHHAFASQLSPSAWQRFTHRSQQLGERLQQLSRLREMELTGDQALDVLFGDCPEVRGLWSRRLWTLTIDQMGYSKATDHMAALIGGAPCPTAAQFALTTAAVAAAQQFPWPTRPRRLFAAPPPPCPPAAQHALRDWLGQLALGGLDDPATSPNDPSLDGQLIQWLAAQPSLDAAAADLDRLATVLPEPLKGLWQRYTPHLPRLRWVARLYQTHDTLARDVLRHPEQQFVLRRLMALGSGDADVATTAAWLDETQSPLTQIAAIRHGLRQKTWRRGWSQAERQAVDQVLQSLQWLR